MINYILTKYFNHKHWYLVRFQYICEDRKMFYHQLEIGLKKQSDILKHDISKQLFLQNTDVLESRSMGPYHMGEFVVQVQTYLGFFNGK